MDIKNQTQLQTELEKKVGQILEKIANEVLDIFKEKYIWKYAYIKNPKMYDRTNEFASAWNFTKLKKTAMTLSKELWYDPSYIKTFDIDKFQHGSKYSTPNFAGANLPAVLEGTRSSLWLSVTREEKFFQKFLEDMLDGGQLEKIITRHFVSGGFRKV